MQEASLPGKIPCHTLELGGAHHLLAAGDLNPGFVEPAIQIFE
jgi:hypothetical protein